jgi:hypothetical protein
MTKVIGDDTKAHRSRPVRTVQIPLVEGDPLSIPRR